jgi:hypothetical protein
MTSVIVIVSVAVPVTVTTGMSTVTVVAIPTVLVTVNGGLQQQTCYHNCIQDNNTAQIDTFPCVRPTKVCSGIPPQLRGPLQEAARVRMSYSSSTCGCL